MVTTFSVKSLQGLLFLITLVLAPTLLSATNQSDASSADSEDLDQTITTLEKRLENAEESNMKDSRVDNSGNKKISIKIATASKMETVTRTGFMDPQVVGSRVLPKVEIGLFSSFQVSPLLTFGLEFGFGNLIDSETLIPSLMEVHIPLYVDGLIFSSKIDTRTFLNKISIRAGKIYYVMGSPLTFQGIDKRQKLFERVPWQRVADDMTIFDNVVKNIPIVRVERFATRSVSGVELGLPSISLGDAGSLEFLSTYGFSAPAVYRLPNVNLIFDPGTNRNFYMTYGKLAYRKDNHTFQFNYAYHNHKISPFDPLLVEVTPIPDYFSDTKFTNFVGSFEYMGKVAGIELNIEAGYSRTDDWFYDRVNIDSTDNNNPKQMFTPVHKDGFALRAIAKTVIQAGGFFPYFDLTLNFQYITPDYFAARGGVINGSPTMRILSVSNNELFDTSRSPQVYLNDELVRIRMPNLSYDEGYLYNDRVGGMLKLSSPTPIGAISIGYGLASSFETENRISYVYRINRQGWYNHLFPARGAETAPPLANRLRFESGFYTPFGHIYPGSDAQYQSAVNILRYDNSGSSTTSGFSYLMLEANLNVSKLWNDPFKVIMTNRIVANGIGRVFNAVPFLGDLFSQVSYESNLLWKVAPTFYILGLVGLEYFYGTGLQTDFDHYPTDTVRNTTVDQLDINIGAGIDLFFSQNFGIFCRFNVYSHQDFSDLEITDLYNQNTLAAFPGIDAAHFLDWLDTSMTLEMKYIF